MREDIRKIKHLTKSPVYVRQKYACIASTAYHKFTLMIQSFLSEINFLFYSMLERIHYNFTAVKFTPFETPNHTFAFRFGYKCHYY